ncbi:CSK2A [Enterospora canceri]|uniref:Casein kinase II subunit alpha n=1 Tax=Enterospora canceri TaxID=1081671 RepID=A0A1Y1S4Z5_9MICR|nr:CSK2A [Enterospora canceri]
MKIAPPKEYAEFNEMAPAAYSDYTNYEIETVSPDGYTINRILGRGRYSEVFMGTEKESGNLVVIKVLKPIKEQKIQREVLVLKNLAETGEEENSIIRLKGVCYDKVTKTHSLIFNHIIHGNSYDILQNCSFRECINLMKRILRGIEQCHSRGIMHRDIKPGNLIINGATGELKIIDFGLAEFYFKKKEYSVRVASKYYKAPELLCEYVYYDYAIDIWSFGAVLGEAITNRHPFFGSINGTKKIEKKSEDVLYCITRLLGKKDLKEFITEYKIQPNELIKQVMADQSIPRERIKFKNFIKSPEYMPLLPLLESCLQYDPRKRPTAKELLNLAIFEGREVERDIDSDN